MGDKWRNIFQMTLQVIVRTINPESQDLKKQNMKIPNSKNRKTSSLYLLFGTKSPILAANQQHFLPPNISSSQTQLPNRSPI